MEHLMNQFGWKFAGTVAGRLTFTNGDVTVVFKSWEQVRSWVRIVYNA